MSVCIGDVTKQNEDVETGPFTTFSESLWRFFKSSYTVLFLWFQHHISSDTSKSIGGENFRIRAVNSIGKESADAYVRMNA